MTIINAELISLGYFDLIPNLSYSTETVRKMRLHHMETIVSNLYNEDHLIIYYEQDEGPFSRRKRAAYFSTRARAAKEKLM